MHCFAFAVQAVHDPAEQTIAHAAPVSFHAPVESQTCGWRLRHWRAPGMHVPPQALVVASHKNGQAVPAFCQTPLAAHSWG